MYIQKKNLNKNNTKSKKRNTLKLPIILSIIL